MSPKIKTALLFSVFVAATAGGALFINGDVILNYASLGFAGVSLSYLGWIKYMFLPSLILMVIAYFVFNLLYGIKNEPFEFLSENARDSRSAGVAKLSSAEIKVITTSTALIVLWFTENLHGIPAAYAAGIIVIILFVLKVLNFRDVTVLNPSLLLFLTAAFSIGRTLSINGIADTINAYVFSILPDMRHILYYPAMSLMIMILHFILGSAVTTLSVVVPTLANLPGSNPVTMSLLAFSLINMQYFLPLHHVTVLIGAGKGYYSQKATIKFGACFFVIMLFYVPLILVQWWRIII